MKEKLMTEWQEKEIKIGEIAKYISDGYEIEVTSPDGFVPVSTFVDKGEWDEYRLETDDNRIVRVNENHLFETKNGWEYAKDLTNDYQMFFTDCGYVRGIVKKINNKIPIVDIQVDHENHRYYTNGVSSHNTGVGKSLFMCHCAAANLMAGKNVLYITMEMAEERIAERIDANLLDTPIKELSMMPKETYQRKIDRIKSKTMGKIIIKEYPTSSAGSSNFRYLLNELKLKKNFKPDIIYIDYLNICSSSRIKYTANINSYTYVKAIAEELRGLAVEFNVPIVTATQTTRGGFNNSDVGLEDTSESFGLPATADLMIALISTEELAAMNQIMVKQLKNRYNDISLHKRFVIGVDKSKMKLYDVEDIAQSDIVDDRPLMDKTSFGTRDNDEFYSSKPKFNKNNFKDFK